MDTLILFRKHSTILDINKKIVQCLFHILEESDTKGDVIPLENINIVCAKVGNSIEHVIE